MFKVSKDNGDFNQCQFSNWKGRGSVQFDMGYIGDLDSEVPQVKVVKYSPAITSFTDNVEGATSVAGIKHTLITLERQDNEEFRSIVTTSENEGNPIMLPSEYNQQLSRIHKFKEAFNKIFNHVEFIGVRSNLDGTEVLFSKNDSPCYDIENLSTGEKQVVFRGSFLLEGTEKATVALIDEPELSMHPRWQVKILDFYRTSF